MSLVDKRRGRKGNPGDGADAPEAAMGRDGSDLAASIRRLATLALADATVEEVLALVVDLAVGSIAGAEAASASLGTGERGPSVSVATDAVRGVDSVQFDHGRGPAVDALRMSRRVNGSLAGAPKEWAGFAQTAASAGFGAVLALPLQAAGRTVGVLVLYTGAAGAFGAAEVEAAELFAHQAAATLANAVTISAARHTLRTLEESLVTRGLIGQAQGVLMARHACSAESAFALLRSWSQRSNRKLRDVAAEVVAQHEGPPTG